MTRRYKKEETYTTPNDWVEAVERGLAANIRSRSIIDRIIDNPPLSQVRLLQFAAQLSQCLAVELQAFTDLERIMGNNERKTEAED